MAESEKLEKEPEPEELFLNESENKLDEASKEHTLKRLFGSSKVFLTLAENSPLPRPELQASLIIQKKAQEHCRNGKEAMEKSQFERAVICFTKAIHLQPEQPKPYVLQGEAYLHLCDFQSAVLCYKQASILEPGVHSNQLAFIYYLQGQCLFDRGLFLDALESFRKASEVKPGCRTYEARSLACLSSMGQYSDCLTLVTEWMEQGGPTSDLYVLRARLHRQLSKTPQCYQDVKCALVLNPSCPEGGALLQQLKKAGERARQAAVDRALVGELPRALQLIDLALENLPQEPRFYLFRGTLYRRLKDFTAAIEDLVQAVELSDESVDGEERDSVISDAHFQLVLTYNDFAIECFTRGLYDEATTLLNKALEAEKNQAGLYLNRGDCFFKQKIWLYALADYQQAEEMIGPNEPAVRQRLSVLHKTLGNVCFEEGRFKDAVSSFSQAVRYNPTESWLYEQRAKAFRKLNTMDEARQDFIRALLLDASNDELPAMLMSLFPGYSPSDVLSTQMAKSVKAQLDDTIQAYHSSSQLREMSQTQSSVSSEERELSLWMNRPELDLTLD